MLNTNVIFGLDDAITDFISNSFGALAAALVGLWIHHRTTERSTEDEGSLSR